MTKYLSPAELRVLTLVADGQTEKGVARVLGISTATVNTYKQAIFLKLQANNSAHAVAQAFRAGLLTR